MGERNPEPLPVCADAGPLGTDRIRLVESVQRRIRARDVPSLVAVHGDAGQGKSSVLAAVGEAVRRRGHSVVSMRGNACSTDLPYAGLFELVTGYGPASGPATELLEQLTSFSARSSPLAVAYAVGAWLRGLGDRDRGLAVLVDDADLVDEDSLRVLAYAATRLGDGRTGVVHTATRPVALFERLPVSHLRLDDLGRDDALACALAAGSARRAAERLVDRLGGNPLALRHAAPLFTSGTERSWPGELPVAARLERDVDARMAPLAPTDQRVLEGAAVTGDDRLEYLAELCGGPRSVNDLLDRLESSGLVDGAGQCLRWRRPWMALAVVRRCTSARRVQVTEQLRCAAASSPAAALRLPSTPALTPSERRVVDVIVSGATVKHAATQLCLSDRTVGTHLQSAYRKLGVRSRAELAALILGSTSNGLGHLSPSAHT